MRMRFALLGLMLTAFTGSTFGQYVFDSGTNAPPIRTVVVTNGIMYVGVTNANNSVAINNGGQVATPAVHIGENASSSNNLLTVGANGRLFATNDVSVGVAGSGNRLVMVDGGIVTNQNGYVGREASANNNSVTVSNGSWALGGSLIVGQAGNTGNSVTVSNGGLVSAESLTINGANDFNLDEGGTLQIADFNAGQSGFNWNDGGTLQILGSLTGTNGISGKNRNLSLFDGSSWNTNSLVFTGETNSVFFGYGSTITSSDVSLGGTNNNLFVESEGVTFGDIAVGGVSNQFVVQRGGRLEADSWTMASTGSFNTVAFDGDGSAVNIADTFNFATTGVSNKLYVQNGATLTNTIGSVGSASGSVGNSVLVSGVGSVWRNVSSLNVAGQSNVVEVGDDGWIYVGDVVQDDFFGTQGGGIGVASSTTNAVLSVSDGARVATPLGLHIGVNPSRTGTVSVANGGTVAASDLRIAEGSAFNLNDGGTFEIYRTFFANQNRFHWNDGGHLKVVNGNLWGLPEASVTGGVSDPYAGDDFTVFDGTNKKLTIDGGSWDNGVNNIGIGWDGSGNQLVVTNGGTVLSENAYVGFKSTTTNTYSDNNSVLVTGSDSVWEIDDTLYVGLGSGTGNTVTVRDSGTVQAQNLVVASNNTFRLTEEGILTILGDLTFADVTGLEWTKQGNLNVGGKLDWDGNLSLSEQTLTLDGKKSRWDHTGGDLIVGDAGSTNQLRILNGAVVSNNVAFVGKQDSSIGNTVSVSGAGSIWTNSGALTIGTTANSNNSVTVSDGGTVYVNTLAIDGENDFNLNKNGTLEITGTFDASTNGFNWAEGTLAIQGTLTNLYKVDGTNRTLLVKGGSLNSSTNEFRWGGLGSGNKMTVSDGGSVTGSDAFLGYGVGADRNTITVSGSGSVWTNSGALRIGNGGKDNVLTIANSGTVYSAQGVIGGGTGTGNDVIVQGTNSAWYVGDDLYVGAYGGQSTLRIEDHGLVTNRNATVGSSANNNSATVTGIGSVWSNGTLQIGWQGNVTNTTSGGGPGSEIITYVETKDNKVIALSGGRVVADTLKIYEGNEFLLNTGGTLQMTGAFNVTNEMNAIDDRLKWNSGGNLSVGGVLSGMATTNLTVATGVTNTLNYLNGGRYLTLDGGSWDTTTNALIVGYNSSSAKLTLTNGGTLASTDGYIGWGSTAANNSVVVGAGSSWSIETNLFVGAYLGTNGKTNETGPGNALTVQSNGWVYVGDVVSGDVASYTNGGIAVAGASGANLYVTKSANVLTEGALVVGVSSARTGTVSVLNGGTITAATLDIFDANSVFNLNNLGTLKITGDFNSFTNGFKWNSGGHLAVGGSLSNNLTGLYGTNQTLSIDGGSWNLGTNTLQIGTTGGGNWLNIINGGTVTNGDAVVGWSSSNNTVLVSGSNSLWNVGGTLAIGRNGTIDNRVIVAQNGTIKADDLSIDDFNTFTLANGGTLEMQNGFVVSDHTPRLTWASGGNLAVKGALSGMPTTNLVANGVTNSYAHLSGGKHLTLLDGGSWDLTGNDLIVGHNSSSAKLTITGSGSAVTNHDGYIGWGSNSANNSVLVTGTNAIWQNTGNLYVGSYPSATSTNWLNTGSGNALTVSNGGWVLVGGFDTNGLAGGVGVVGTNVIGNGSIYADQGFYVGNTNGIDVGSVSVLAKGAVTASDLQIRSGSSFNLDGSLSMTGDFNATQAGTFNWNNGGKLTITNGNLTGLSSIDGTNKVLTVNNADWTDTGLTNFVTGVNNRLSVINGGTLNHNRFYIGASSNDWNNSVSIANSNSAWNVANDLVVGDSSFSNTLSVTDNGTLNVGGNVGLLNDAEFTISTNATILVGQNMLVWDSAVQGAGTIGFGAINNTLTIQGTNAAIDRGIVFDGSNGIDTVAISNWNYVVDNTVTQFVNWENLALTDAVLSGTGDLDLFKTNVTINGGIIRPSGELYIRTDSLTIMNDPTLVVTVKGVNSADSLRVSGNLSNATMRADITINSFANVEDTGAVILTANGAGLENVFAATNAVTFRERYFLYDFALTNIAADVKVIAVPVAGGDISSSLEYAGWQGVRNSFNAMEGTVQNRTKQLRRNLVATEPTARSRYYATENDELENRPEGPDGPGDKNQIFGMNIWAQQFSGQGSYDKMGNSDGFTMQGYGTTFGFDRLIGDSLIAGVNYTYARSSASMDDAGNTDTETYWLAAYSEWFNKDGWFVDGLLAYGWSDYTSSRPSSDYLGIGKYDGTDFGGSLDAGRYLHWKNWALAPYAGINYLTVSTESHQEVDAVQNNAIQVQGERYSAFETALGAKLRNRFDTRWGRIQTSAYAEWSYDHVNDHFSTTLRQGSDLFHASVITPSAEMINTGVGVSWTADDNYEIGLGYDARFNENYQEHLGTIMINVMF